MLALSAICAGNVPARKSFLRFQFLFSDFYAYNLIRWATDAKEDKTLKREKTHTKCGGFLGHFLL